MYPGSLSDIELTALREDMDYEIGDGCVGKFYRYTSTTTGTQVASDGTVTTNAPTLLYQGPVEFSTIEARRDRYETRLGEHVYLKQYRVNLSDLTVQIYENDRFEVVSSHADAPLVGREMIVKDVHYDAELSKRRITVVDTNE